MIHLDPFVVSSFAALRRATPPLGPACHGGVRGGIAGQIGAMPAIMDLLAEYEWRLTPVTLNVAGGDTVPARRLTWCAAMTTDTTTVIRAHRGKRLTKMIRADGTIDDYDFAFVST